MMISEEITDFLAENRLEVDRVTLAPEVGDMIVADGLSIERHTGSTEMLMPVIVVKPIHQERIILKFDRFDRPKDGEYFIDNLGIMQRAAFDYRNKYVIYKIEGK